MSAYLSRRCGKCGRADPPSGFAPAHRWCRACELLLDDPTLTRKCRYCHRNVTKDVGQFATSTAPGTGRWEHPGSLLPYGGPDRCASLVQHFDAGHREYDIWATEEMSGDEYVAAIERLRRLEDVQWVLRKVGRLDCLPPGDGLIENPRPPFSRSLEEEAIQAPEPRRLLSAVLRHLRRG